MRAHFKAMRARETMYDLAEFVDKVPTTCAGTGNLRAVEPDRFAREAKLCPPYRQRRQD